MRERELLPELPVNPSEAIDFLAEKMVEMKDGKRGLTKYGKESVKELNRKLMVDGKLVVIDRDGETSTITKLNKLEIQGRDGVFRDIDIVVAAAMTELGKIVPEYLEKVHKNHYVPGEFIG